jgi:hypothetical protein
MLNQELTNNDSVEAASQPNAGKIEVPCTPAWAYWAGGLSGAAGADHRCVDVSVGCKPPGCSNRDIDLAEAPPVAPTAIA